VTKGARYTVLYRSRPAFQIVPIDQVDAPRTPLEADPLYRAPAVGPIRYAVNWFSILDPRPSGANLH